MDTDRQTTFVADQPEHRSTPNGCEPGCEACEPQPTNPNTTTPDGNATSACDCYVRHLDAETRFGLHFGAHNSACPQYRVSLDPVDRKHDEAFRAETEITPPTVSSNLIAARCIKCLATRTLRQIDANTFKCGQCATVVQPTFGGGWTIVS